jgi:predicted nucleic-acid-binding Zn-ribbon protein
VVCGDGVSAVPEAGRAFVTITPDFSAFNRDLAERLKTIAPAHVNVKVDDKALAGFEADIKRKLKPATQTITAKVDAAGLSAAEASLREKTRPITQDVKTHLDKASAHAAEGEAKGMFGRIGKAGKLALGAGVVVGAGVAVTEYVKNAAEGVHSLAENANLLHGVAGMTLGDAAQLTTVANAMGVSNQQLDTSVKTLSTKYAAVITGAHDQAVKAAAKHITTSNKGLAKLATQYVAASSGQAGVDTKAAAANDKAAAQLATQYLALSGKSKTAANKAAQAFDALGITQQQLQATGGNTAKIFDLVTQHLKSTTDSAAKTVAANKLLGASYVDGSKATNKAMAAFTALGITHKQLQATGGDSAKVLALVNQHLKTAPDSAGKTVAANKLLGASYLALGNGGAAASLKAMKPFEALGITQKELQATGGNTAKIFDLVTQHLKTTAGGAAKTAAEYALLGKGAAKLNPLLANGGENMKSLERFAASLGVTLNDHTAKGLEEVRIAQAKMHIIQQAVQLFIVNKLVPAFTKIADWITKHVVPAVKDATKFFSEHKTLVITLVGVVAGFAVALKAIAIAQDIAKVATVAWSIATKAAAGVQWLFNAALDANPIGLVVIAIAALTAGVVYAYTHFKVFRDVVKGVFDWLKGAVSTVIGFVKDHWKLILGILTGPLGLAVVFVVSHFNQIVNFVKAIPGKLAAVGKHIWQWIEDALAGAYHWVGGKFHDVVTFVGGLPGKLAAAGRGIFDFLKTEASAAINFVLGAIQKLVRGIGIPGFHHLGINFGGFHPFSSFTMPTVHLAAGGTATKAGLAVVGEQGPELLHLPTAASVIPLPAQVNTRAGGRPQQGKGGLTIESLNINGRSRTDAQIVNDMWLRLRPHLTAPAY